MTAHIHDRRAHQCKADGCDSEAKYQAWLIVRMKGFGLLTKLFRCKTFIKCCERHTKDVPKYLLSPENRQQIMAGFIRQGYGIVDFDGTIVAMEPVDAPEPMVHPALQ